MPRAARRDLRVQTGPTEMEARFQSVSGSPLPWKTENELNLVIEDTKGHSRGINDTDFRGNKSKNRSEAGESTPSVFSVDDFGYSAAFMTSSDGIVAHEPVQLPECIMDTHDLQTHLGLKLQPGRTVQETLEKAIENHLEYSITSTLLRECTDNYLPINHLHHIFSGESVLALIKELYPNMKYPHQDLIDKTLCITGKERGGNCRLRILAILIFSRCLRHLDTFVTHDVWDQDLPISISSIGPGSGGRTSYATRTNPNHDITELFEGWERYEVDDFFLNQPRFNVPFFDLREGRLCSYEFESKVRLPWTWYKKVATGGTGTVYQIKIHPGHHNYPTSRVGLN